MKSVGNKKEEWRVKPQKNEKNTPVTGEKKIRGTDICF